MCARNGKDMPASGTSSKAGSPRPAKSGSSGSSAGDGSKPAAEEEKKGYFSTLSALPDTIKYVQNLLSFILNLVESSKNIINWTLPKKTFPVYIVIIAAWLLCFLIPNRYIILIVGLSQFLAKFFPKTKRAVQYDEHGNEIEEDPPAPPILVNLYNLVQSIPNDYDLESSVYYYERKELAKRSLQYKKDKLRLAKLSLCLPCLWDETVEIKVAGMLSGSGAFAPQWKSIYLVLQGRRLVWWASNEDVTAESAHAECQLLLYGHTGITEVSPVDLLETGKHNASRLLCIFGSDVAGMHMKCTVLCQNPASRNRLEAYVQRIVADEE